LTGPAPLSTQHLVRIDRVGPAIAAATGIGDWTNLSAELVSGGKSNLTFELVSAAGSLILRRPPSGELLPSAHDMGREARIQRALAPTPVPVAPIVLEDGGDLIGVPFYVMEKMPGHVIRGELPDGYATTPKERRLLTYTFVDTLAALHAVDPDEVGLGDYGRPNGFLERQIRRWGGTVAGEPNHRGRRCGGARAPTQGGTSRGVSQHDRPRRFPTWTTASSTRLTRAGSRPSSTGSCRRSATHSPT